MQSRLSSHRDTIDAATPPLVRPLMLAIHLAFAGLALSPAFSIAHAQQVASTSKSYNIPAGPLSTVLSCFISESGIYLSSTSELAQGKNSPGLQGNFSAQAGLAALLAGTGLEGVNTSSNQYVLRRQTTSGAESVLPAVTVKSDANETATGPVIGYVAKRSATGTKTDISILENPQSISVITADELNDRKVESLDETLRYTAGATPNQRSLGNDESSLLRGFELGTTGIFQDGLRNSVRTFGAPVETYGLERVEVLRGPASVLYGQIPPGGMVNAVSKRPTLENIREIGVEYGTYDRKQLKADFSGALDEAGIWSYRLTMLARNSDTRLDVDKDNRLYIAPALTWKPDANTKLTLLARYQKDNQQYAFPNQFPNPGPLGQVNPSVNVSGYDNRWKRSNTMLGYEFEHTFNDTWSMRQNLRYTRLDREVGDLFPYALTNGRIVEQFFDPSEVKSQSLTIDTSAQARFTTGSVKHTALVGLDYSTTRNEDRNIYQKDLVTGIDLYNPVYVKLPRLPATDPNVRKLNPKQMGLYVQDQLKWDKWVVTAGLRHDKTDQSVVDTDLNTGTKTINSTEKSSATTGRLGAVYLFDSGWAPYVSYATSFTPEITPDQVLKPSTGKQIEAGIRYQHPGQDVTYTAAVFDLVRQNVTTAAPGLAGLFVQTGEVSSRGLELEARAALTRSLSVVAQYTYLDTKVTESNNGDLGMAQRGAPKNSASVWSKYSFLLGGNFRSFAALGVRYTGAARSNLDENNLNLRNPSFTMVDAALGLDYGQWHFALNVNNLFNKQFIYDCGYLQSGLCYRSAERTANLSAIYRF